MHQYFLTLFNQYSYDNKLSGLLINTCILFKKKKKKKKKKKSSDIKKKY